MARDEFLDRQLKSRPQEFSGDKIAWIIALRSRRVFCFGNSLGSSSEFHPICANAQFPAQSFIAPEPNLKSPLGEWPAFGVSMPHKWAEIKWHLREEAFKDDELTH